jgi:Big-like domain-containing protein/calcineurin-like phosphoesterase family protein
MPNMRRYALLGSALVVACTVSDQTGPNSDVTDLMITPGSVALAMSQSVQLQAKGHTKGGGTREVQVSWSATGGAIDGNGLYTADTSAGDFDVTATLDNPHLIASAQIHVRGSLRQVVLVPAQATLATSAQLQFYAYGLTSNGDSVGVTPTFAATSGTISLSGMYTAPGVEGSDQVVATAAVRQNGPTVADTSQVTITSGSIPVASVEVTPASASIAVNATVQLTATPKDANGTPLSGRTITWATGSAAIATVSASGLVSGVGAGSATITATAEGQSGTAAITVTSGTSGSVVFVGAGDISDCGNDNDEATAQLLDGIAGTVYTLGDNVYSSGTATEFSQCYDPTWGRHKARTMPAPGNHDYNTSGASGYYGYFGTLAGPSGRGYYSFDLGDWHIVSLNSEVSMSAGSAQETWLRADLAASTKQCTLAYWHKPRFSSGTDHGSLSSAEPLWQALYDFHAELVLAGHEHNYERFAPQTPTGVADPTNGIREFVAGTGGESHYDDLGTPLPNSEVFNGTTFGVLKLTLGAGTYAWQFIPVAGQSFTDSGSGTCH